MAKSFEDENEVNYTIRGKEDAYDFDENPVIYDGDKLTYAKKQKNSHSGVWRYFIKIDAYGKFVDPTNKMSSGGFAKEKFHKDFVEVDGKTFKFYLSFLKTKNKAFLLNAERGK